MSEQNNLLDELRCLKNLLAAEQTRATSLQAALDLKTDQLRRTEMERDYFRNIAADLVAKAEMIEQLVQGMTQSAASNARLMIPEQPQIVPQVPVRAVEEELKDILSEFQPNGGREEAQAA